MADAINNKMFSFFQCLLSRERLSFLVYSYLFNLYNDAPCGGILEISTF